MPCHLCIFQRVTLAALGIAFLFAALLPDRRGYRVFSAALIGLAGLATIATAGRHVWIQMQPAGTVAPCGADLEFMLDIFPLTEVILKVFRAGGECANVDWTLLGLSMPAWVLAFAVVLTAPASGSTCAGIEPLRLPQAGLEPPSRRSSTPR